MEENMASDWNSWNTQIPKRVVCQGLRRERETMVVLSALDSLGFLLREITGFVVWIVFNT